MTPPAPAFAVWVNSPQGHLSGYRTPSGAVSFDHRKATAYDSVQAATDDIERFGYVNSTSVKPDVRTAYVVHLPCP